MKSRYCSQIKEKITEFEMNTISAMMKVLITSIIHSGVIGAVAIWSA